MDFLWIANGLVNQLSMRYQSDINQFHQLAIN